jgi:hypothetical protein
MSNYIQRLKVLEQVKVKPLVELPLIVNDESTDHEINVLEKLGYNVYRASDKRFIEEFI